MSDGQKDAVHQRHPSLQRQETKLQEIEKYGDGETDGAERPVLQRRAHDDEENRQKQKMRNGIQKHHVGAVAAQ